MTEVGWIPKDWEVKKISDVATNSTGLTYSPDDVSSYGTLVLRSSNIQNDVLAFEDNVFVLMDIPERAIAHTDDILVCVRNGSRALIGKSAPITEKADGMAFGAFMTVLRATGINPQYLLYAWRSSIIQEQINATLGATINQITNADLKTFDVPLPTSPSEQRLIASVLSDTDSLIASLSRTIEKKRLVKQGAMQQLLTGKTRLKGFSGEWVEKDFKEIYKSAREGGTPDTSKEEYYANGNIYFVKIDDMKNKYVVKAECKINEEGLRHSSAWTVPRRSILFSNGATIGRVCITNIDLCTKQGILGIVPKEEYNVEYLYYVLSSDEFMREVTSRITIGTMPIVYLNKLNEIKLYLPEDPNEQFAISERLRTMDNEIASLEAELQKYKALKQGMMQKLLTGQIRLV